MNMTHLEIAAQNKAVVTQLMGELGNFTLRQLTDEFYQRLGEDRIDYIGEGKRIRGFIDEMCEFGVLSKWLGRYTYVENKSPLRH